MEPALSKRRFEVLEIEVVLNSLRDEHRFISGWRRDRSRWYVTSGAEFGPYGLREIRGFLDGCRAMGAAI